MDESYLLAAARYVETNPVSAGLLEKPAMWQWSSAQAHISGVDNALVKATPLLEMAGDWKLFLAGTGTEEDSNQMRCHERTGSPLKPGKPGPKGNRIA